MDTTELERASLPPELVLTDLTASIGDFADTAALIASLDLTITVDTSVAHLAGAMGRPVWTLLTFAADWRWLANRSDSPWYPTMRLFRQQAPGDWPSLIGRLVTELAALSSNVR
jgi:ADP-heptose:LPS heptosyltransferase